MNIDERKCTIEFQGRRFTNRGAYIDDRIACVYLNDKGQATTWKGDIVGTYYVKSTWTLYPHGQPVKMRAVVITLEDGRHYHGTYGYEWKQFVKARRFRGELRQIPQC